MNIKIFFIALILSLPLWLLVNLGEKELEDFLVANNPQILTARVQLDWFEKLEKMKPIKNREAEDLKIEAKSAISIYLPSSTSRSELGLGEENGKEKILFEKNFEEKLPIASLTKLMTALVVLENYNLSQIIEISKTAVSQTGDNGRLKIGEIFQMKDLLYPLLMESSNDAAYALAEVVSRQAFVDLMNLEAQKIGLENTVFGNPTGLDPDEDPEKLGNYSTPEDLVKLVKELLGRKIIWQILSTPEYNLYSPDGVFHHRVVNTNELLAEIPEIIGGKTGYTAESDGCLLLVLNSPFNKGIIINIILGSPGRFSEMRQLLTWVKESYQW